MYGTSGCSDSKEEVPNPDDLPISEQLIRAYDDPQEMCCHDESGTTEIIVTLPDIKKKIVGSWSMISTTCLDDNKKALITKENDPVRFDSLVKAHGDDHWNLWEKFLPCLFRETTGLHVVCDRDYDAGHPTGTLLDDLLLVHYYSLDSFLIHGEYVWSSLTEQQKPHNWTFYEFEDPLPEFNKTRHKLIAMIFIFNLIKAPVETSDYVFTCTWTNEDGKKLTASTDPLRIQGEE